MGREEEDKTSSTWSAAASQREREEGWGGRKDEARPGDAGINGPGPEKNGRVRRGIEQELEGRLGMSAPWALVGERGSNPAD